MLALSLVPYITLANLRYRSTGKSINLTFPDYPGPRLNRYKIAVTHDRLQFREIHYSL
jgi:hypothetical protein